MKHLVVLDGTWHMHRAFHAVSRYSRRVDLSLPAQVIDWACTYAVKFSATHLVICFDGRSSFRYDIFPEYKANRVAKEPEPRSRVEEEEEDDKRLPPVSPIHTYEPFLQSALSALNIGWQCEYKFEADDLLGSYSVQPDYSTITLVCNDKDMMALVNDKRRVRLYTPELGKQGKPGYKPAMLYDEAAVEKAFGYPPSRRVAYQILVGDKIDNIPRIYPARKVTEIMQQHPTLADYFKKNKKEWAEKKQALTLNKKLVELRTDVRVLKEEDLRTRSIVDTKVLINDSQLRLPKSIAELVNSAKPGARLF